MPRSKLSTELTPVGVIASFDGLTAPSGWLICDGSEILRSEYNSLFNVVNTRHGVGDGSTTFCLPDLRASFIRGYMPNITASGSGSASANAVTFTSHGFNRTGLKIRRDSGTLTGIAANTDYYIIVVDENTLAFATTYANALNNVRIAISGVNSLVIVQFEDPDASNRLPQNAGGVSGNQLGAFQEDAVKSHRHNQRWAANVGGGLNCVTGATSNGAPNANASSTVTDFTGDNESRPKNITVNYIIKY